MKTTRLQKTNKVKPTWRPVSCLCRKLRKEGKSISHYKEMPSPIKQFGISRKRKIPPVSLTTDIEQQLMTARLWELWGKTHKTDVTSTPTSTGQSWRYHNPSLEQDVESRHIKAITPDKNSRTQESQSQFGICKERWAASVLGYNQFGDFRVDAVIAIKGYITQKNIFG